MKLQELRMLDRYEQVRLYTPAEFERRWQVVRRVMQARDCRALAVFSPSFEGYDQWLADVRGLNLVIVPESGAVQGERTRGAFAPSIEPLTHAEIEIAADLTQVLRGLRGERVAVVNPAAMTVSQCEALGNAELVDVTLDISVERAVKSAEEILAIRSANRIHEKAMLAMQQILRPGRTFRDVSNDISGAMMTLGSGNGLMHAFIISLGRQDEPHDMRPFFEAPSRSLEYGDRMMILLETNGLGGHCTAIGRFFSIGEPSKGFQAAVNMCVRAQTFAVSMLKPGTRLSDIVRETRRFIEDCGWETNDQCFMHGMGYHMYEQLGINDITENIPMRANMMLHAHPVIKMPFPGFTEKEPLHNLNAYLVSDAGGVCLNNVEQNLFVVG